MQSNPPAASFTAGRLTYAIVPMSRIVWCGHELASLQNDDTRTFYVTPATTPEAFGVFFRSVRKRARIVGRDSRLEVRNRRIPFSPLELKAAAAFDDADIGRAMCVTINSMSRGDQ